MALWVIAVQYGGVSSTETTGTQTTKQERLGDSSTLFSFLVLLSYQTTYQ